MNVDVSRQRRAEPAVTLPAPPENWVPHRPGIDQDVLIVGAGQSGMAIDLALQQAGIGRTALIEAGPAHSVGMWDRTARMLVLRTPKTVTGPEIGHPSLSYPFWHEAVYGPGSFAQLPAIETRDWIAYLAWYRQTIRAPIAFGSRLTGLRREAPAFVATIKTAGAESTLRVRKVVFATGFAGCGGISVPEVISAALPASRFAHSGQSIDLPALRGKRVAVLGAASSAFDAAAAALDAGAEEVHLLSRRAQLPAASPNRPRAYAGAQDNFQHLPDALRWRLAVHALDLGMNPPLSSVRRVVDDPRFRLHLAAPVTAAAFDSGAVRLTLPELVLEADFVIAATGYRHDLSRDPVLGPFAPLAQEWADRIVPAAAREAGDLARTPYLDTHFCLIARAPEHRWLSDIHIFSPVAALSHGRPVGDAPSLAKCVPLLVAGIARDLFLADIPEHETRMFGAPAPEFDAGAYAAASR